MMKTIYALFIFSALFLSSCAKDRNDDFIGSGTIEATEVTISARTAGEVIALLVDQGVQVKEGQLIAVLDTAKISIQKEQLLAALEEIDLRMINAKRSADLAEDNFKNAGKKLERIKALFEGNSATQQQFDDMSTAFKAALTQYQNAKTSLKALQVQRKKVKAQIQLLQIQLQDAKIAAPSPGIILEKYI
ncbi:MAG: biotin/lipoyl-binding protein, partial [Calditrichaeota bacterium]|nr:biotin/lipoyl-binding protein [Calditrichota bacterium]